MAVLTVDITELAGLTWGDGGANLRGWVESNAEAIVGAGTIYMGRPQLDFTGTTATVTLPATTGEVLYRVVITTIDGGARATVPIGWFALTADANLADLAMTTISGTYPSLQAAIDAMTAAQASATAAAASAAQASEITGLTGEDGAVSTLVATPGTATATAIAAYLSTATISGGNA